MHCSRRHLLRLILTLPACLVYGLPAGAAEWSVNVRFENGVREEPYSGRVYLFFSKSLAEPRRGPDWFRPELFVARDVSGWKPGETLAFSSGDPQAMLSFPQPADHINPAGYRVQAVARFNPFQREIGRGTGNGYSNPATMPERSGGAETPALIIDRLVNDTEFPETRWCRELVVPSSRLTAFHGRNVSLKAAVMLPAGYHDESDRRYPAILIIPGFGGTHHVGRIEHPREERAADGVEFLRVVLDPGCPLGHHVFADSANNGPVGTALVEEFLPEFDRQFRSLAVPSARFLTGHSSGGWSSLWLQIAHPDDFGGVWSTSPDPVDFRDWQQVDLYEPSANLYVDAAGNKRPIARRGGEPVLWYEGFAQMERVLGHGGQLHSFEAVFSPRDRDGRPQLMFDRETGAVDPEVAKAWKAYDIRLVLERNWSALGPKLAGKLNVFTGELDTFYLEGAVRLLKQSLADLGSDAVVEIHDGKDHRTLLSQDLRDRIRTEMGAAFLREHGNRASTVKTIE